MLYICSMEIRQVLKANIDLATTGADLFSLAKASFMFSADKTNPAFVTYVTTTGEGQTIMSGFMYGGTSNAIENVAPAYFPVATFGSECGAVVNDLAWADSNLNKGYEFLSTTGSQYFVSGVLNSSQTLSNDPFGTAGTSQGFISGACWSSSYTQGVNPFA